MLRTIAEFENSKKRAEREKEEFLKCFSRKVSSALFYSLSRSKEIFFIFMTKHDVDREKRFNQVF